MNKILIYKRFFIKIFFLIFLLYLTNYSFAQKSYKQKQKEFKKTKELLNNINKESLTSLKKLELTNLEIEKGNEYIDISQMEILNIENQIKKNDKLYKNVNSKLQVLKKDYNEMIYYAYKMRQIRQKTIYILSAKDFNQAYKRFKYIQFFTEYLDNATNNLKKFTDSLTVLNNKLKNDRRQLIVLKEEKTDEIIYLNGKEKNQRELVSKLLNEKNKLKRELKKKFNYTEHLNKTFVKYKNNKTKNAKSIEFERRKGSLNLPVVGVITSNFGNHRHPVLKNVFVKNDGIEITVAGNYNVKTIYKGIVSKIIIIPGANKAILIKHGQYFTVYSNLSDVYVKENQKIVTNQKIGKVFRDKNNSNSGILNFQIWYGNEKLNPRDWLK